ncbi:MAG: hypothetical protein PHR16_17075, partial [Methylovulum sp.]|nr:hypothetical protein [Methylovulum sp.]
MKFSIVVFCLLLLTETAVADAFNLPLQLDYGLIKKVVVSQLYKGAGQSAELWHDKHDCSHLTLSDLQISGQGGQIRLLNNVNAQFGTQFGGQCITILQWGGLLETLQKPTLNADHTILSLPVTKAVAYDQQGRQLNIGKLQELIKQVVEPKLSEINIDLNKSRGDIERTLIKYVPKSSADDLKTTLASLKFNSAEASDDHVSVKLAFDAAAKVSAPQSAAVLTAAEQQQSQYLWREWDGFLTKAIEQASQDTQSAELRDTLTQILLESRTAFQAGLNNPNANGTDPQRVFFTDTWER